jgi:hypothetical protein
MGKDFKFKVGSCSLGARLSGRSKTAKGGKSRQDFETIVMNLEVNKIKAYFSDEYSNSNLYIRKQQTLLENSKQLNT